MSDKPNFVMAFPSTNYLTQTGMTLRDYFAAKAMQGFCSQPFPNVPLDEQIESDARCAYAIADAMLKAREA